jgi:NitT/TauT family transport system substrate-binding protein
MANLEYTSYEQAVEFMGVDGNPGKLHGIFDEVMQLNLENGAADTKLDANQQIDNSIVTGLFEGHTR